MKTKRNSTAKAGEPGQAKQAPGGAALLDSINVGTLFLDTGLNIKRYTATATKLFNLIPSDIGRPIDDIRSNLKYDTLPADAQGVLETLRSVKRELETKTGQRYLRRTMPSQAQENLIDGLVVTFTDISRQSRADQAPALPEKKEDRRHRG